jgi:hypothetical protein
MIAITLSFEPSLVFIVVVSSVVVCCSAVVVGPELKVMISMFNMATIVSQCN